MDKYRLVIDFASEDEEGAQHVATLAWLHLKQVLLRDGMEPNDAVVFHGVKKLGGDG